MEFESPPASSTLIVDSFYAQDRLPPLYFYDRCGQLHYLVVTTAVTGPILLYSPAGISLLFAYTAQP